MFYAPNPSRGPRDRLWVTSPHTGPSNPDGERGCAPCSAPRRGICVPVLLPLPMTAPFPANCYWITQPLNCLLFLED